LPTRSRQGEGALAKLLPLQRKDFEGIFEAMNGRPVTIRTIDPPLHEFVPHEEQAQRELAKQIGITYEKVRQRVESLHEFNPMLGFRGCRLGIIFPEITEMQSRAIFEAAANVQARGIKVEPEDDDPARRQCEGAGEPGKDRPPRCSGGDEGERGRSSRISSAR
jgi:phosphoenolpyruvate synthase/pyruvate phosphate dikinase